MKKLLNLFLFIIFCMIIVSCSNVKSQEVFSQNNVQNNIQINENVEPEKTTAKITAVGDIMVHDYQYNEAYNHDTGEYNFMHNFQDMKKYFEKSDVLIGNLETTFAGAEKGYSSYPLFNTPDSFLDAIKDAGFDVLSTVNNHCADMRSTGIYHTIDLLDEYNIEHIGTYKTQQEQEQILIKDVNGIKIAFLAYTYGTNGIPIPDDCYINILDEEVIKNDITKAKEISDLIVIMPHMGIEYEIYPRDEFKQWVDFMFNAGADIIIASHPHVLQPMEYRTLEDGRTGFVIYSMGNFISSQTTPPRNASIVLNIDVSKIGNNKAAIDNVSFIPIWTQFRGTDGKNHFVVRSVYEMLTLGVGKQKNLLRQKDISRLWDIHYETTSLLLGGEGVPIEEMKDEYIFPKP